jgi:two-component system, chemotaxis family, CheB/CheR fusion protein
MNGRHILLVDDDVDTVNVFRSLLQTQGFTVDAAHNGKTALLLATARPPDAAILNISMPGITGLELCRRMRAMPWGRNITIAALSGWGRDEDRQAAIAAGCDSYLVKPVKFADLLAAIGHS